MAQAGWRLPGCVLVVLLFVCGLTAAPVGGAAVATTGSEAPATVADTTAGSLPEVDIDADVIVMEATIDENGSAAWRVTYQMELGDDTEIEAFEDIQAEIRANQSSYLGPFRERMNRTVVAAESAAGREMSADEFEVVTERESQPQSEFGLVVFQFEWDGFAEAGDTQIRAGQAIDSLFLDEGERLEFRWPEAYGVQSSTPEPQTTQAERVVWRGPIDFDRGEPRVQLATGVDSGEKSPAGAGSDRLGTMAAPLVGVVGLALVGATALLLRRRDTDGDDADGAVTAQPTDAQTPPDELLSNEERVLQLLKQNGGRMKQKAVADQLDWTAAKTSQVVGDLREEDSVEAFRLGRENVLTLPDVDLEGRNADDDQPDGEENA